MSDAANKAPSLGALMAHRDLILVTGKGGVGKSTVTAALAEVAARQRRGAVAVESAAHARLPAMLGPSSQVQVVNLDLDTALPGFLSRLARLPHLLTALINNRVIRLFLRTAPAVSELVLLDEVRELVAQNSVHDRPVVVDLPATGHAVTLLGTPRGVRRLVRVGPVARLAENLEALIFDRERCELVVVALPEELPINETIELVQRAKEVGLACRTVVVNQVPEPPIEEQERGWLNRVGEEGDTDLGRVASAARIELEGADEARAQIERLRGAVEGEVVELPRFVDADPRRCVNTLVEALAT